MPNFTEQTYVFWTSLGDMKIMRAVYEEGQYLHIDTLYNMVKGLEGPSAIIADATNQLIYWTDFSTRQILRGPWDGGGNPELLYAAPYNSHGPVELTLDFETQLLYWTQPYDDLILSAPADGSGQVDTLFTSTDGLSGPWGIALSAGYLYWVEFLDNEIWRVNLSDRGNPELLYAGGSGFLRPFGVAISEVTDELFITDNALPGAAFSDRILKGSPDGRKKLEIVYDGEDNVSNAYNVLVDGDDLYWHNQLNDGGIYKGSIYGGQPVQLVSSSNVGQGLAIARSKIVKESLF
ncbi:hypothetical protein GCM10011506_05670 [Marivirga lumbricoides]|uniref:Low-density lipoprotein receptor repeat class B n=2 Tax=Marivirga lumbricoides TaxID=1046115 RepID=A0ABQ1LGU0_9BACT|nr:hypothetical protein GCM10011506_05670 [Marivirga lumbricoides]